MFRQRKYDTRRIDRQYAEETDVYVMLYNSYADALYAYGMGFGFDNETVKDVIHDIFLDIMTRQVDLGRIVNIKAYLFRIVHNRLVDLHRSRVDKCDLSDREPGLRVSLTSLDAMIESEHVLRIRQTIESLLNQLSPKQRENVIAREAGTVFIGGIGAPLRAGAPHDGRAPDYDDWSLNGDLLFWHAPLECAMELSSMGIRVDPAALDRQLTLSGHDERRALPFHKMLLAGELPLTIGGGIGQSRLCMLLLSKIHVGEVQVSLWDEATRLACAAAGVPLL